MNYETAKFQRRILGPTVKVENGYYCSNICRSSDSTDKVFRMFVEKES